MSANPYRIEGPALISFSGGRSSGKLLYETIQAFDGELPQDVRIAFANTGCERLETLRFADDCARNWGVPITWLEWRPSLRQVASRPHLQQWIAERAPHWTLTKHHYEVVGPNSASRNGEPFEALIMVRNTTPNAMRRFCTEQLKVAAISEYLRHELGWRRWTNVVGLRHDEGLRIMRRMASEGGETWSNPWQSTFPLSKAKVTKQDVAAFWKAQPFDLGIKSSDGNCAGCFLLSPEALMWRERQWPGTLDWYDRMERGHGNGRFVTEYSYADLKRWVQERPILFEPPSEEIECVGGCVGRAA